MPDHRPSKPANILGAGAPLALLIVAGTIIGGLLGQPSIGLLTGLGLGLLLALLLWWNDRRK